ncbi:DUF4365 domain-containing protein [Sulfurovum sp. XGS-02]|uniref:DUF4365 domain-containing protein n=1 Tax=Sulfurovum sp. XGS-02 TaxID=2925411 RepID=UPI002067CF70|nr:DUF4365 domain-containing protein [Sulfurovum sp. XGS-02]UPT78163.1 DUF4365 domain-containing protein [Sulfurovum sp. XGS-02]
MIYPKKSATGQAGEHYFSYWVLKNFQWPCRLFDIDLGIDAQVEILDNNNHTTGNFIAVQIKTTDSTKTSVPVKVENLKYWESIDDAVVLVLICMKKKPKIYWKLINDKEISKYIKKAKVTNQKSISIKFSKENKLSKMDKSDFSILPYKGDYYYLGALLTEIKDQCKEIKQDIKHDCDTVCLQSILETFNSICFTFDEVDQLIFKYPKINFYSINIEDVKKLYQEVKEILHEILWQMFDANPETKSDMDKDYNNSSYHKELRAMIESRYL